MEKKRIDDYEPGSVPPPRVDHLGFVKQELDSPGALAKSRSVFEFEREERRIRKWRKMIGLGGSDWKHYVRRKPHIVKRRIRKGIPDCLWCLVWQLISGSRDILLMNPGVYEVGLPLVQQYLFQFDHLMGALATVRRAFYSRNDKPQHVWKPVVHYCFLILFPIPIGSSNMGRLSL